VTRRNRLTTLGALVGLIVYAADQGSKYWILHGLDLPRLGDVRVLPVLDLTMVRNRGVTFGLLTGNSAWSVAILVVLALAIVVGLAVWLRRTDSVPTAIALGGIAGGALGNVTDRLHYGWVVDFIRVHAFGWSWYVFNIGDAAIVCGVAALALLGRTARPGPGSAAETKRHEPGPSARP